MSNRLGDGVNLAVLDRVIPLGTPGVGKSCFLDFSLCKLIADNKSVLCAQGKSGHAFLCKSDGNVAEVCMEDAINGQLDKTIDHVLLDPPKGNDPNFWGHENLCGMKFVLAVSTDHNNCQGLWKNASTIDLCMGGLLSIQDTKDEIGLLSQCATTHCLKEI